MTKHFSSWLPTLAVAATAVALIAPQPSRAEGYPNGPIRLIVPYAGGAKVQIDLAGGPLQSAVAKPSESQSNIKSALVRPIAVFVDQRVPAFADVPTFKEKGYNVFPYGPLLQMSYIVAPRGIPAEARDRLVQISKAVVASAEYRQFLVESGLTVDDVSGDRLVQLEDDVSNTLKKVAGMVLKTTPR